MYRCDRSDERKSHQQAKVASWKAKTKGFSSINDRFLQQESYRNSKWRLPWTEETGLLINNPCIGRPLFLSRRLLNECDTAPPRQRADCKEVIAKFREAKEEAVAARQVFNSHIPVEHRNRQRQEQQFQQSEELRTDRGSTVRPVACSVKYGSSWESWWSSADSN